MTEAGDQISLGAHCPDMMIGHGRWPSLRRRYTIWYGMVCRQRRV